MANVKKTRFCNLKAHTDKRGETYFKGKINKYLWLIIFPNLHKNEEASPDYIAFLSEDLNQRKENKEKTKKGSEQLAKS